MKSGMALSDSAAPNAVEPLKAAADRAMARGDPRTAKDLFERAVVLARDRLDIWLGLAACRRAVGDPEGALAATQGALTVDPRCFPALLMKGSLLESMGLVAQADAAYGPALLLAPPEDSLPEPMRRGLARARDVHDRRAADLAASLRLEAESAAERLPAAEAGRIDTFIEAMTGRRKIFHQEPVQHHYPGMPPVEFHDRAEFPWLADLEARTDAIRAEVLAVWAEGSPDLEPYIDYADGVPLDQWAQLNRSLKWSAFHLIKGGALVEANCRRCPATMEALALVDQPKVPGRSPAAMFSILRPRTRLPPHTGVANTRLVLHLPLIVPEGCGFRVGGETRQWREGQAWVFDDTIEHEAWNDSDLPRAILICDVWSPNLSPGERDMIARLVSAHDRFNGGASVGGDL